MQEELNEQEISEDFETEQMELNALLSKGRE